MLILRCGEADFAGWIHRHCLAVQSLGLVVSKLAAGRRFAAQIIDNSLRCSPGNRPVGF
jgi:hypothetical protein